MPLVVGGAALGGSLISGIFGSKAADQQASSAASQTAEARRQFNIGNALALGNESFTRQQMLPGQVTGYGALNNLNVLTGQGGTYIPGREELQIRNQLQELEQQQALNPLRPGLATSIKELERLRPNMDVERRRPENVQNFAAYDAFNEKQAKIDELRAQVNVFDADAANYQGGQTAEDLLQSDPSYKWRFQQGAEAQQNAMSTNRRGGSFARAMNDYGQGAASQEYQNIFNRNATLAGYATPSTATGQGVVNTAQSGGNITNAMANQTNVAGASASAWGNAINSGISGLTGIYQQNQLVNAMNPQQARYTTDYSSPVTSTSY